MDQVPMPAAQEPRNGSHPSTTSKQAASPPRQTQQQQQQQQRPQKPVSTRTISTHSTESVRTIRGTGGGLDGGEVTPDLPLSASYPFPVVSGDSGQPGTPTFTPGAHQPFTALSPTVTPSPAKAAKNHISQEFRASGIVRASAAASPGLRNPNEQPMAPGSISLSKPNLLEVAVHLQSELGLHHWWHQVSKTLKAHFGAERATLAVATDATDVENVPWAQLATFWDGEDDGLSRVTNDAQSSRTSLRDVTSPAQQSERDRTLSTATPGPVQPHKKALGLMGSILPSRPKIETRHSYAGYPSRHKPAASDILLQPSSAASTHRPLSPTFSTNFSPRDHGAGEHGLSLNEELLRRHDDEDPAVASISDDFLTGSKRLAGTILQPPQPLESEADPLISASGVLKVLGRDRPVVLTREYLNYGAEGGENKKDTPGGGSSSRPKPKRSPGIFGPRSAESRNTNRRTTTANAKDSLAVGKPLPKATARKSGYGPAYEDYEQFPGTPWAQSPAPSPAARADPDENPFFANEPDAEAFADSPPEHLYLEKSQIAAIGIDKSRTIIQVPLIHPSARLSHVMNSRAIREESRAKSRKNRPHGEQRSTARHDSYLSSENIAAPKRIPIAILSVLTPNVPYPVELIDSFTEMAPLLAASFYAARSHSNILLELSAVSGRRRRPGDPVLTSRDTSTLSGLTGSVGLTLNRSRDHLFSPSSPMSSASASTQSTTPFSGNRENIGFHSAISSPVVDTSDEAGRRSLDRNSAGAEDPGNESHVDYFSRKFLNEDKPRSPTTPNKAGGTARQSGSGSKKKTIHSHGASFATTQPSLPSAAASVVEEGMEGQALSHSSNYKEPSSSVLRTMIDNGATQQFIAEPEHGRLIWANSKFMAYRNAPKDNIHEQLWSNIYPKDIHRFQREWNKSLESGEQLSHQVRLKRFDGQYRYFHMRFLPLKDRYGVTKYWHGQAMDIHELHEAEVKAAKSKEKAASEARYRAIANSLPVIVFAASVPGGMTFANTQWLSYSGQDLEEALGFGFLEHVHPEDLVKCRFPGFDPTAKSVPPVLPTSTTPSLARNDSSVSSTGESEETNATLRGSSSTRESSGGLDIPNELLRRLAADGIVLCAKDQQGNLSITTEMRLKDRRGQYRWHLVQGSYMDSVNFGQGEAQWFIACTDISNQKHNEAKIQDANSALEDVNSALEKEMKQKMNYLSSMSHEIRTPLNGIIGNLQFLINSGLDESAADWAHGAQEAARNMHDLINDILDLSKAEANMLQLASHWFNTRGLMEQVLDLLNSKAAEKAIELSFECDESVPQSVKGDSQRIRQVLLNLVGNAIKFTQVGEVTIKCDMLQKLSPGSQLPEARADERFIRWSITDTGSGFTSEDRKLLFKPYSQLKNKNTRDSGGTGLGLILCKTMVTLHGGSIDATSRPGLGSTFTFFARFRIRTGPGKLKASKGHIPLVAGTPDLKPTSPTIRSIAASEARDSPALLSDSSSARSFVSADAKPSVRSSASTTDSAAPMKLTLPPHPTAPRSPDVSLSKTTKVAEPVTSPKTTGSKSAGLKPLSPRLAGDKGGPILPPRGNSLQRTVSTDLERASFRPPMISALVVCSTDSARRVTCEQIRQAVPQSVPCSIASQASVEGAFDLLLGDDPVIFTHIVLRLASSDAMLRAVKGILAEPQRSRICIVVLLHQEQAKYLQQNVPELNIEELSRQDRLKLVMKPAHTYKLAKIFDPFNENSLKATDPKEAKRQEEKRLQKEAYDLFKKQLGNKGIKVMAVEDNSLQMNILHNFLAKICCLEVTKAWNGKESFDLYKAHEPGYYSVIITDIEMPVMDGLTMCRKVREWETEHRRPPVNLVSLSAHAFSEGWNQSSEAGFSHYCPKPVQFRDLGYILLELADPSIPHKYLRERQMPRPMLKKLGLLPLDEDDSDDDEEY